MNRISSKHILFALSIFLFLLVPSLEAQEEDKVLTEIPLGDIKREEIQRYFGYENVLFRYLTVPYDSSINVNQQGRFVDIGFLLIAVFPLILLGLSFKNKKAFYSIIGLLTLYLLICLSNSLLITLEAYYPVVNDDWDIAIKPQYLSYTDQFLYHLYAFSESFMSPMIEYAKNNNALTSKITYGILFSIFLGLLYWSMSKVENFKKEKYLLIVFMSYFFLWMLLSGGIIWYGFLFIPLIILFIGIIFEQESLSRIYKNLIFTVLIIWTTTAIINRVSNIDVTVANYEEHYGKTIINGTIFPYAMGIFNEDQTIDYSTPNLSKALNKINADDELIYMVGTSFSFNIRNNLKRIFSDNALGNIWWIAKNYPDKSTQIDVLKQAGIKYMIIDLHTPSLDKTPEQSLTQKFQLLLNTLYQNPSVGLIGTDRIIEFIDSNGNQQKLANVFGEKILNPGSYAIYEIL